MAGISRRKQQRKGLMNKARSIKLDRITKTKSTNAKVKRNAKIIAAASNVPTKSTSNRFSKLMNVYKNNLKLKKWIERERMKRVREAKRTKRELQIQQKKNEDLQQNSNEDDEVMEVENSNKYATISSNNTGDITVSANANSEAPINDKEQPEIPTFIPRKNVKFIKKRTVFYRIRKLRALAEEMTGGAAYVNSPNQRKPVPLHKQAELLFLKKMRSRQINHLSVLTGKCYTYKTLMKKLKPILEKYPIIRTEDDKLTVSLIQSVTERLKNIIHKLPQNKRIRVTLVADKGEKITKICYYFNDVLKPQATENLGVLCFYIGDDDGDTIKNVCEILNDEMEKLINDGLVIDKVRHDFEFFVTGDCKSICSMLGVQG